MKLCEKCNKINVDDAVKCRYCGETFDVNIPYGFKVVDDLDDELSSRSAAEVPASTKSLASQPSKTDTPNIETLKTVSSKSVSPTTDASKPVPSNRPKTESPKSVSVKPNPPKVTPTKPKPTILHDEDVHSCLTIRPALTGGSIKYKQRIDAYDGFESIKCPKCGSDKISLVSNTKTKGFSTGNACCGYMVLGPLGFLCGSVGSNKTSTTEYWVCGGCGNHFKSNSGNAEKERIKRQAMMLSEVPDDTIDNVESILSASTPELAKIKEASKKAFVEEYKSNGTLLTFGIIAMALVVVAFMLAILLCTVFDAGFGASAISALAAVVIAVVATIIKPKLESKYASAKYNQIQQDLKEAVHINNKLKALKAAKEKLSKLRII